MIWPICKFLEKHNYPSAIKTGLELLGKETGALRKPSALLTGGPREELRGLLENAGLKTVGNEGMSNGHDTAHEKARLLGKQAP